MPNKFHGTYEELQGLVAAAGHDGTWSDAGNGQKQFRTKTGAVLNWWETSGTLQFQGQASVRDIFKAAVEPIIEQGLSAAPGAPGRPVPARKHSIFVVHGHDKDARDDLELALRRLGLEPFILMNSSGGGKTIIEALEGHIGRDFSSDFGIVLMTPDDVGYAKKDGAEKAEPRARQNVILETGMLLASLTRSRMVLLIKGHLEIPSDLQGIIWFGFNDHVREVMPKLCARLREVGIDVDPAKISEACA